MSSHISLIITHIYVLINPDPYNPNVDEDGVIIEPPVNQQITIFTEENKIDDRENQEQSIQDLEETLGTMSPWQDSSQSKMQDPSMPGMRIWDDD
jgi:hypothetical protein